MEQNRPIFLAVTVSNRGAKNPQINRYYSVMRQVASNSSAQPVHTNLAMATKPMCSGDDVATCSERRGASVKFD